MMDDFIPITWKLYDVRDTKDGSLFYWRPDKSLSEVPEYRWQDSMNRISEFWKQEVAKIGLAGE